MGNLNSNQVTDLDCQLGWATELVAALAKASRKFETVAGIKLVEPIGYPCRITEANDQGILRQLIDTRNQIIEAHSHVTAQRQADLVRAQANTPFVPPREIRQRMATLDRILKLAGNRDAAGLRSALIEGGSKSYALLRWLADQADGTSHRRDVQRATLLAEPGSQHQWRVQSDCDAKRESLWEAAARPFHDTRDELAARLEAMEQQHNRDLERAIDPSSSVLLQSLRASCKHAQELLEQVDTQLQQEIAGCNMIRIPWRAAHEVHALAQREQVVLNDADDNLARQWCNSPTHSTFLEEQMRSARCAEVASLDLYQQLYGHAEDLSILQLRTPLDRRWQLADIWTNGRMIDIKNARRSLSSQNSYSEFFVKRFKSDRIAGQVVISAWLSHYFAFQGGPLWLGETSESEIDTLCSTFDSEYLSVGLSAQSTRLPPWLFDYPEAVYSQRDVAIAHLRDVAFQWPRSSRGFAAAAPAVHDRGAALPRKSESSLIAQRVRADGWLRRPVLFLHVLDSFCRQAVAGRSFPHEELRDALFPSHSIIADIVEDLTPLAVADPLGTIHALLETLRDVSEYCQDQAIKFTSFQLSRPGILRGRLGVAQPWVTIIAYCGGWGRLPDGSPVRCGQDPLYLGKNARCPSCNKLTCHSCGFCTRECRLCDERQRKCPPLRKPIVISKESQEPDERHGRSRDLGIDLEYL
jgi:hypothetical protein